MEQKLIKNTTVNISELFDLNYQYFHYGFIHTPSPLDDLHYYIDALLGGLINTVFDKNIHNLEHDLKSRIENKKINPRNIKFAKTFLDYVSGGDRWKKYQLVIPYMRLPEFKLKDDSKFTCEKMKIALSLTDPKSVLDIYENLLEQIIEYIQTSDFELEFKTHKPSRAHPDGYIMDYIHVIGEYPNFQLKPNEQNKIAITVSNLYSNFPSCKEILKNLSFN